ncbi:MAG: hypothetical protein EZS28_006060 [Streblomastix strix]|uniref:Uncharacterized protein n=1 Tax=Streblomastix strix TaxID=222440 RepID=A0A5J4WVM3_9EUKA|nr:MAG: hypothetical protein EZS28_006060 [Streblomastix strix]
MSTIQTNQIRVHKSKHANVAKKELSEEDKARLQTIDDAVTNGFRKKIQIPFLQILRNQLQPIFSYELSGSSMQTDVINLRSAQTPQLNKEFNSDENEEFQRGISADRPRDCVALLPNRQRFGHREYNILKFKEVQRETAQVEPEQVVKETYLSHPNLEVQKFIIDVAWHTVNSRKKCEDFIINSDSNIKLWALITQEEENDIEIVMEEPLMRYNNCTSKKYKKKEIVRSMDVFIKNVSNSNIDNVLWNSIEKLYRVKKYFVRLSDKLESGIGPDDF